MVDGLFSGNPYMQDAPQLSPEQGRALKFATIGQMLTGLGAGIASTGPQGQSWTAGIAPGALMASNMMARSQDALAKQQMAAMQFQQQESYRKAQEGHLNVQTEIARQTNDRNNKLFGYAQDVLKNPMPTPGMSFSPNLVSMGPQGSTDTAPTPGAARTGIYESGNDYQISNKMGSGAYGKYQFMPETWADVRTKNPELNLPADMRQSTPSQQEAAKAALDNMNGVQLKAAGFEPNATNLYLAHRFGAGGATNVLKSGINTPLTSILPGNWFPQNPDLQGKTVGDFTKLADARMGGVTPQGQPAPYSGVFGGEPSAPPPVSMPPGGLPMPGGPPPGPLSSMMPSFGGAIPPGPPPAMEPNAPPQVAQPPQPAFGGPQGDAPQADGSGTPLQPAQYQPPLPSAAYDPGPMPQRDPRAKLLLMSPETKALGEAMDNDYKTNLDLWKWKQTEARSGRQEDMKLRQEQNKMISMGPGSMYNPATDELITNDPIFGTKIEKLHGAGPAAIPTELGAPTPAPPGAPALNIPGRNEEYLKTLPAGAQLFVKAFSDGRMPVPTAAALRNPTVMKLMQATQMYDNTFDAGNYPARAAFLKNITSGPVSEQKKNMEMFLYHSGNLLNSADALNNENGYWGSVANPVSVANMVASKDPRLSAFSTDKSAVLGEFAKVMKGSQLTDAVIKEWGSKLESTNSPEQFHSTLREMVGLMEGRLQSIADQATRATGRPSDGYDILSPKAKAVSDRVKGITATSDAATGSAAPDATMAPLPKPASKADFDKLPSGSAFMDPDGKVRVKP